MKHLTPRATHIWNQKRYWIFTGLFVLLFMGSAILTVSDLEETKRTAIKLGYPTFLTMYPLAIAKVAGIAAILVRRWPVVTLFAFAGFMYDLILALSAHFYISDVSGGLLAVFGLMVWCTAFWVERDRVRFETH